MVFRIGKYPSKTAQTDASYPPSLGEIFSCPPDNRAACLPACLPRAGWAESIKCFKWQAAAGPSDEGRAMGPPLLSPPVHPHHAWLLPLAPGKENSARLRLPSSDGSVPAMWPHRASPKTPLRHFTRTKMSKQAESALLGGTTPSHRGARAEREVTCPKATQ